jgi:uncharacterized protein (TIGR03067 family)
MTLLLLIGGLLSAADAKKDAEKLQGTWKVVSVEEEGRKPAPAEQSKVQKIVIKNDKLTLIGKDLNRETTFQVDVAKTPRTIDLTVKMDDKAVALPGIYLLEGDDLKLCLAAEPGAKRPTEFKTEKGAGVGLFVLKRDK